jgi:4-hydroxy-2-oxoheptanedioate aldolase
LPGYTNQAMIAGPRTTEDMVTGHGPERLRQRWQAGEAVLGGWVMTHDAILAEELARCGFDEVTVDLQHGSIEIGHLVHLFAAISAGGAAPLVRIPTADPVTIGRVLDLGAAGVVVAMIESTEAAAAVVRASRYMPAGTRSAGPLRAHHTIGSRDWGELEGVMKAVMIETAAGLANVESIAATPGLDAIYVGPGDLGLALGMPPGRPRSREEEDRFLAALDRILDACREAGIAAGIHTGEGLKAAEWIRRGFQWATVVSEYGLVINGGTRELAVARQAIQGP